MAITTDGFQFLLKKAEVRLRGTFELEFVDELYEYFKDHDPDLLVKTFELVGALGVPVNKIRFEDFTREVYNAQNPKKPPVTVEESRRKAQARTDAKHAENEKAHKSWTMTTDEVLEEMAKKGNKVAASMLADRRRESKK